MTDHKSKLKELSSFMQDKGFVYGPSPEIYGGLAGFFDYGPMGKLLKNNIENAIRKVFSINQFFEVECPTVLPSEVWEASGHLSGFTDPMIKDENGNIYRVDNLIEEFFRNKGLDVDDIQIDGASDEQLLDIIKKYSISSPDGFELLPEIKAHNLMMKTTIGVDREAFNRPETATTTYLPFLRYLNFFREKLPFGVFQIGKAYRNEISPRQFMLRMREFTQAEAQIFLFEEQKKDFEKFDEVADMKLPLWTYKDQDDPLKSMLDSMDSLPTLSEAIKKKLIKNKAYAWTLALAYQVFIEMGIPEDKMRLRQHNPDELAFYADDAWDLEIDLNTFGWTEVCGIHDRKDYDLGVHAKASGKKLEATKPEGGKAVPHILEIAFGTDRPTFALLDIFYELKDKDDAKTMFKVPYNMAPIPVMVFPLVNKLSEKALSVFKQVQKDFVSWYDKSGSVGKRYLRADSVGTPFCVTVDFDGEEDNTVTIRDRDSSEQKRVKLDVLNDTLSRLINGSIMFNDLK